MKIIKQNKRKGKQKYEKNGNVSREEWNVMKFMLFV